MLNIENIFYKEDGILYLKTKGVININYYLKYIDYLSISDFLPRNLKILEDSRDVTINLNKIDLDLIIDKLEIVSYNYVSIRHALVQNIPLNTAYGTYISNKVNNNIYYLKLFSTVVTATEWVRF